jgi:hypothetical protein
LYKLREVAKIHWCGYSVTQTLAMISNFRASYNLARCYPAHMADESEELTKVDAIVSSIKTEIDKSSPSRRQRIYEAIALAALSSIPWVGGVLAAAASYNIREGDVARDGLIDQWLLEHHERLQFLRQTLEQMATRLEGLGEEIDERIHSEQYLVLVRKTFRQWDEADTDEKRRLLVQLITNAAGTRISSDDIVRLFLDWLATYHEAHLAVIREIQKNQGPTRYDIWVAVYGEPVPLDNSADADLYKMLIRDLTIGGVIRQPREADGQGRFLKKHRAPRRPTASMESAFEDTKSYVLTELGSQFVHYAMTELVARLNPRSDQEAG